MKPVGVITTFKEIKELASIPDTVLYLLVPSNTIMKMRTTRETKFVNKAQLWERSPRITKLLLKTKHYGYRTFSLNFEDINMGKNQNEKRCWIFTNYWFAMAYAERRKQK
jgi:hypothetical protein